MTERSRQELRRSTRLSQIFSARKPSKKNTTTPKNLNKRKQLKSKAQSNSQRKKLIEVDVLLDNNSCSPGHNPRRTLTRKSQKWKISSCNESNSERRMSLRSFKKFSEFEVPKRHSRKISENASNANKERRTLKKSVENARKDKIVTMSEGKNKGRRSRRLSLFFSANTPTKKSTTPQNLNKKKQLEAKIQCNRRQKKSVEVDVLLSSGICPSGLKPKTTLTRKSEKRKLPSCNDSFSERRTSLRSRKKFCPELETSKKEALENTPNFTKSNKKIGSKTKRKPKSNEYVKTSISSTLCDSAINSFSMNKSNNTDCIPLDDLLFVTSSRNKKPRDVTRSSGICSAHSSFTSSVTTSSQKGKSDDLLFISPASVNNKNGSFKIPETKKRPGKKTLKHKRMVLNELNVRNSGHEDDLLENIKLTPFKKVFDLDNESEASWNIATPKCGFKLSPFLPKRTPVFKDCFSPTELQISRKNAEEFIHRNNKRKTLHTSPQELPQSKQLKKNIDALEVLKAFSRKQKNIERSLRDEFSDEEKDDDYYSEEEEFILNNAVAF